MKIAILGASGIGRSHARWFVEHGCEIVSILGSSDESAAQTGALLQQDFGFAGLTYSDLSALLQESQPEAVCIATPSTLHFGLALECLEAGVHVLCEKPLVYAPGRKPRENLDGAKELVRLARKKKLILATQLQYGAATPILTKLAGTTPPEVGDFAMEFETANPHSPREPRELWMDLAPHPISIAQFLAGENANLVEESVRIAHSQDFDKTEITVRFQVACADGRLLMCRAILRALDGTFLTRKLSRRFAFNGRVVGYQGVQSADGQYRAQYASLDGYNNLHLDPVSYLIGDFLRAIRSQATPLISGEFGMRNMDWLLKIAAKFEGE
ncbi:putative dehydrogenase [Abditibacterium utsteinense]|uniref:Putative dehydrogenase n=1 Tax=Abditibacterium utsteinense TaxID=1960156 RepID=A0A2S8SW95_9BACT|nr:Gfo/Idh/MocA family oxidoreductase [Abditibacterium utsteinense]PQV65070.1 putative dehydrogenase [Abditibacterium utsteinense]